MTMTTAALLEIDDRATWPLEVTALLVERVSTLCGLADVERAMARYRLMGEVDRRLTTSSVLAWHCTRLCPDEVAAIATEGMFLPSLATVSSRLRNRVAAGDMPADLAARLLTASDMGNAARSDRLWFSITRHALSMWASTGPSGAGLLDLWGGEVVILAAQQDPVARHALAQIGSPFIVEKAIPIPATSPFDVAEALVSSFEIARGLQAAAPMYGASFVASPIGADRMLHIATPPDLALTRHGG